MDALATRPAKHLKNHASNGWMIWVWRFWYAWWNWILHMFNVPVLLLWIKQKNHVHRGNILHQRSQVMECDLVTFQSIIDQLKTAMKHLWNGCSWQHWSQKSMASNRLLAIKYSVMLTNRELVSSASVSNRRGAWPVKFNAPYVFRLLSAGWRNEYPMYKLNLLIFIQLSS